MGAGHVRGMCGEGMLDPGIIINWLCKHGHKVPFMSVFSFMAGGTIQYHGKFKGLMWLAVHRSPKSSTTL